MTNMSLDTRVSRKPHPCLLDGMVQVWTARIDDERMTARYGELLGEDERARAGRFVFERDRVRFVQSHGIVRLILGEILQFEASKLKFSRDPDGKPRLDRLPADAVPEFSLSHSGDYCVVAVGSSALGVDIERIRDVPQMSEIAGRHFTPDEFRQIAASSGIKRQEAFFASWTRREAVAKALGCGLGGDVEALSTIPPIQLQAPAGYAAALAHLGPVGTLTERAWSP